MMKTLLALIVIAAAVPGCARETVVVPVPTPAPAPRPPRPHHPHRRPCAVEAIVEVNEARARRGLRAFQHDAKLTEGAKAVSEYRAERLIAGHARNDFDFLPEGAVAKASGCAAWHPRDGWGACCTYENWTDAGAAWALGRDGKRYMHLFVR